MTPITKRGPAALAADERKPSDALLSIGGVAKWFEDTRALHQIDLDVARGEFFTLLGPSGCGKTTLLRIIGGFERPSAGTVLLDGQDLGNAPPEARPFNMVFQSYALFPHMSVWDNVAYGLRIARQPKQVIEQRVRDALALVHLEALARRSVRELSGGQQQRVALVRALVNEPRVLLLDEPLGALDLKLRKRMQEELRAIQTRLDTTFIYVTHDQQEALNLSHRIGLMNHGRLIQVGTPREVYDRPISRFVAEFVGDATLLPGSVEAAQDGRLDVRLPSGAVRSFPYYGAEPVSAGARIMVALRPEHLTVGGGDDAVLTGEIAATIFLGDQTRYELRLDDGTTMHVRATDERPPGTGERVGIRVLPGCGVAVIDDEPADNIP